MGSRRAVVHIGQPKTGTTSIQTFLSQNRAVLESNGFACPDFLGFPSQSWLLLFALEERPVDANPWVQMLANQVQGDWHERVSAKRDEAVAWATEHSDKTLILSCEGLSTNLNKRQISRFAGFLTALADEVCVLLYVRDPVGRAISAWSTTLSAGISTARSLQEFVAEGESQNLKPPLGGQPGLGNVCDWEEVFPGRVQVRLFHTEEFVGGNLIHDFCATTGIQWISRLRQSDRMNESLSLEAMAALALLNAEVPRFLPDGRINPEHESLAGLLRKLRGNGSTYRPSDEEASAIYAASSKALEWLRSTYFPDREELWHSQHDGRLSRSREGAPGVLPQPGPTLLDLVAQQQGQLSRIAEEARELSKQRDDALVQRDAVVTSRPWRWTRWVRDLRDSSSNLQLHFRGSSDIS